MKIYYILHYIKYIKCNQLNFRVLKLDLRTIYNFIIMVSVFEICVLPNLKCINVQFKMHKNHMLIFILKKLLGKLL